MTLRDVDEARHSQDGDPAPSLFGHYELDAQFFDETFESEGQPRAHYQLLIDEMERMSPEEVTRLQERVTRSFLHEGITFTVYGDEESIERVIPIDCVPRLVLAREWEHIERGLIQRVQALKPLSGRCLRQGAYSWRRHYTA